MPSLSFTKRVRLFKSQQKKRVLVLTAVANGLVCHTQDLCSIDALVLVLRGQHHQRRSNMPLDQSLCPDAVQALTQSVIATLADPRHHSAS